MTKYQRRTSKTPTNGDTLSLRIRRLNIVRISILPRFIYRFNTISIKIPVEFFVDIDTMFLNSIWKDKGTRITKVFLKKKKKVVKFTVISGLQVIKMVLISARTHRPVGQHRVQRQTHTRSPGS